MKTFCGLSDCERRSYSAMSGQWLCTGHHQSWRLFGDARACESVRRCGCCKEVKLLEAFGTSAKAFLGKSNYCLRCSTDKTIARHAQNPEKVRRQALEYHHKRYPNDPEFRARKKAVARKSQLRIYGLNVEDYERLHAEQDGLCAICKQPEKQRGTRKNLSVDHNHTTGAVRGLLCRSCNTALGLLQEDISRLAAMTDYIVHWNVD